MTKVVSLACALALAALSASACAGEAQGGQGFVRGEIGRAKTSIDGLGSDKDTSYGIGGGYWFNANWGIEGSYNNLFNKKFEDGSLKLHNLAVAAVAKKNFGADGNGLYIGGRLGYAQSRAKAHYDDGSYSESSSVSSSGLLYGVGVGYDINRDVGLGLNYAHYRAFSDTDVNNLGLSVEYRF